jgi:hypothetical protein
MTQDHEIRPGVGVLSCITGRNVLLGQRKVYLTVRYVLAMVRYHAMVRW